jgi:uncharacterized protein YlxW (UPF0749 family)
MTPRALAALLAITVASGCADALPAERSAPQLEDARRTLDRKEVEIRAYQWQLATLAQQLRDGQQRSDALEKELHAQVQQLIAANATLAERLKHAESDQLAAASAGRPGARGDGAAAADAVRRMLAASDAHNAQIVSELARIARALGAKPTEGPGAKAPAGEDVVDPWGFGARK